MKRVALRKQKLLLLTTIAAVVSLNLALPAVVQGQTTTSETTEQVDPRLAEAEELNQQVIKLYEQGKYQEAIPLAEKALSLRQEVLGNNHLDVATSLNNLAALYESQGRYTEAEPFYLQTLEIRKQQLGEDHPDYASSLHDLAGLYRSQGRYTEAEPLYLRKSSLSSQIPRLGGLSL